MLDEYSCQDLVERVLYDKATMNTVFANKPKKGIMMRVAVGRSANMWFQNSSWDNGHVRYELTAKAEKKTQALARRKESTAAGSC